MPRITFGLNPLARLLSRQHCTGRPFDGIAEMIGMQDDPFRIDWGERFALDYVTGALTLAALEAGATGFGDPAIRTRVIATLQALLGNEQAAVQLFEFLHRAAGIPTLDNRDGFFWGQHDLRQVRGGQPASALKEHRLYRTQILALAFPLRPIATPMEATGPAPDA